MTAHILLIENSNLSQTESLATSLESQGYQAYLAHTLQNATKMLETLWPNLVVFNPLNSGLRLSSFQETLDKVDLKIPSIVVSDKSDLATDLRTDALFVTPGNDQQLSQTITKAISKQKNRFIRLPDLILDQVECQILRNQKRFSLTPKEFKLLHLLILNHDQVLSRKTIMQKVWETDYMGDTRTLDVHVRWLREKIEEVPSHPQRLITVRGVGYRFIVDRVD